jgi:hypothetical protein
MITIGFISPPLRCVNLKVVRQLALTVLIPVLEETKESQASEHQLDSHPLEDFRARRTIEGDPQQTGQSSR